MSTSSNQKTKRCLLCSKLVTKTGQEEKSLNDPSSPRRKYFKKAIRKIFKHLLLPKRNLTEAIYEAVSFCTNCIHIVEEVVQFLKKKEILELQIQDRVQVLGRIVIETPVQSLLGGNSSLPQELWEKFKGPVTQNFIQGLLPNPSVHLRSIDLEENEDNKSFSRRSSTISIVSKESEGYSVEPILSPPPVETLDEEVLEANEVESEIKIIDIITLKNPDECNLDGLQLPKKKSFEGNKNVSRSVEKRGTKRFQVESTSEIIKKFKGVDVNSAESDDNRKSENNLTSVPVAPLVQERSSLPISALQSRRSSSLMAESVLDKNEDYDDNGHQGHPFSCPSCDFLAYDSSSSNDSDPGATTSKRKGGLLRMSAYQKGLNHYVVNHLPSESQVISENSNGINGFQCIRCSFFLKLISTGDKNTAENKAKKLRNLAYHYITNHYLCQNNSTQTTCHSELTASSCPVSDCDFVESKSKSSSNPFETDEKLYDHYTSRHNPVHLEDVSQTPAGNDCYRCKNCSFYSVVSYAGEEKDDASKYKALLKLTKHYIKLHETSGRTNNEGSLAVLGPTSVMISSSASNSQPVGDLDGKNEQPHIEYVEADTTGMGIGTVGNIQAVVSSHLKSLNSSSEVNTENGNGNKLPQINSIWALYEDGSKVKCPVKSCIYYLRNEKDVEKKIITHYNHFHNPVGINDVSVFEGLDCYRCTECDLHIYIAPTKPHPRSKTTLEHRVRSARYNARRRLSEHYVQTHTDFELQRATASSISAQNSAANLGVNYTQASASNPYVSAFKEVLPESNVFHVEIGSEPLISVPPSFLNNEVEEANIFEDPLA